jgi:hypothetical protein
VVSAGTSNTTVPLTVFPGLIWLRNVLPSPRYTAAVLSAENSRSCASNAFCEPS